MANKYVKRSQCIISHQEKCTSNYTEMPLPPVGHLQSKTDNNKVGEDVETSEYLVHCWWESKRVHSATLGKRMFLPQMVNAEISQTTSSATPGYVLKRTESNNHTKACTQIFTEAFIHNSPNIEATQ